MKTTAAVRCLLVSAAVAGLFASSRVAAFGFQWTATEWHLQYGTLEAPSFAGGGRESTFVATLEHADGWQYGDNFFFVDFVDDEFGRDFNVYAEVYSNFSLTKVTGRPWAFGPVKDVGILLGFNGDWDAEVRKYLPGVRFVIDAPGFSFLNVGIMAYLDDSAGAASGGAPREDDTWHMDVSWHYPFKLGAASFTLHGHFEYVGERRNEFGVALPGWFLAQPQLRYDLGEALVDVADRLLVGFEYQYWSNKLGDEDTDESRLQALLVLRF